MEFWRIVTSLGVPGLALGIFYRLHRNASRQWPISRKWTPLFLALWMLLGSGVVLFALWGFVPEKLQLYQVRVTVLSPSGQPLDEGVKAWSTLGGEPKKVAGGWEFEIPAARRPAAGKLPLYASHNEEYGEATALLGQQSYVTVTIRLKPPDPVPVSGSVQDGSEQPVAGVRVVLEETGAETRTAQNGRFQFPPCPRGEPVTLRVERAGHVLQRQLFEARGESLSLRLGKVDS